MKSLHSIPNEFKYKRNAKKATFELPQDILKAVAKYLSVHSSSRMRIHVNLNRDGDPWTTLWFNVRYTYPYARYSYLSPVTLRNYMNRWDGEQVDEERLEIVYA